MDLVHHTPSQNVRIETSTFHSLCSLEIHSPFYRFVFLSDRIHLRIPDRNECSHIDMEMDDDDERLYDLCSSVAATVRFGHRLHHIENRILIMDHEQM